MANDIINGHNLRVRTSAGGIYAAKTCTLSISGETRNTSHKDLGSGSGAGWAGKEYGEKSWSMTTEALFVEAVGTGADFDDLWTAFNGNTKVALEFTDDVVGHRTFTGNGVITSLDLNAPDNEEATYSVTFEGDGTLTKATVS